MKTKSTLIFPRTDKELIAIRHFLVSRNRVYQTVHIPVNDGSGEKIPMVITELDLLEKVMVRACYNVKPDRVKTSGAAIFHERRTI